MKIIQNPPPPPLHSNDRGDDVVNLQDALLFLLEKRRIDLPDERRRELEEQLRSERERQQYLDGTIRAVTVFQEQNRERFHLEINGEVDQPTAEALNKLLIELNAFDQTDSEWVVRGQIMGANGPVNEIQVSLFDRDLLFRRDGESSGQLLKTEITKRNEEKNEDGWFEIKYTTEQFKPGDIAGNGGTIPDLIFALSKDGQALDKFAIHRLADNDSLKEETIVSDDDLILGIEARKIEEVCIILDGGEIKKHEISEYEKLWQAVESLLPKRDAENQTEAEREQRVCTAAENLDEEKHRDVSFIARETGLDFNLISSFVASCRLSAKPFDRAVLPSVFYGLARSDKYLTNLARLATATASKLKEALKQATDQNLIPILDEQTIDSSIEQILRLAPEKILNQIPFEGQPTFNERIGAALPDSAQQATMLRAYAENKDDVPKFWEQLRALPEFAEAEKIERVQFALQLDALTQSHVPLMKALQTEHNLKSTRELLDFGEDKLRELLLRPEIGVPVNVPVDLPEEAAGNEDLRRQRQVDNYVTSVMGALQLALPTESVAKVLRDAPATLIGDETTQTALATFFANTTSEVMRTQDTHFDIRNTNVDDYLKEHGEAAFSGIAEENREQVISQVKRSQRLFNVSTDSATFEKLVGMGFDSAREIASIPQQTFVESAKDQLGEDMSKMIYSRATNISTSSLHYYTMFNDALNGVYPHAVKAQDALGGQTEIQEAIAKHIPNWQELFGSPELCECGHCQSVYSPAAYLVDILHFLEKSGKNANGLTPLDILIGKIDETTKKSLFMGRRPDLAHLKLTCENTETALPYVDLVNEVLESLAIAYATATEDHGSINVDYNAIAARDTGAATTPELKANPQYSMTEAYQTPVQPDARARLDRAVYPLNLPYDHSLETARVYLENLGAKLSILIDKFGAQESKNRLAAEILGLSPAEYEVVTGKKLDESDALIGKNADEVHGFVPELLPALKIGDVGKYVVALKQKLNTNGAGLTLDADPAKETFDAATETAIKALQQAQNLDQDGAVKIGEWRALTEVTPSIAEFVLPNVRELLGRVQISYEELDNLVRMRFLNPEQNTFDVLEQLRIPTNELLAFIAANFQNPGPGILDALTEASVKPEDFTVWATEHFSGEAGARLKKSLVLDAPPEDECNLDRTILRHWDPAEPAIDAAEWHKLNRLIRLWRKLGWDLNDLDDALIALKADDITPEVIVQLSLICRTQEQFDLSVQQIIALWGTPNTKRPDSLYRKRFLSKAALAHDPAFSPDWKGDVLVEAKIKDHIPALLAGLRLKSDDLNALLPDQTAPLTLETISSLFSHATLARTLGLGFAELSSLKKLSGVTDPFVAPAEDWDLLRFTNFAQLLQNTELSVPLLAYVLEKSADSSPFATPAEVLNNLTAELKTSLEEIGKQFAATEDPRGETTRARLSTLHDDVKIVNSFVQLLDGTADYVVKLDALPKKLVFPDKFAKRIKFDKQAKALVLRGALTKAERTALISLSANNAYKAAIDELGQKQLAVLDEALNKTQTIKISVADAEAKLINKGSFNASGEVDGEAVAEKFKFVLEQISPVLQDLEQRNFIKQKLAEYFGVDSTLVARLIDEDENGKILLHQTADNTQPLVQDFISPTITASFTDAFAKLQKAVLLVTTLGLSERETVLLNNQAIDFNQPGFDGVQKLAQYVALKRELPKSKTPLANVLAAGDKKAAIAVLAEAARWPQDLIESLTDAQGFNWDLADLQDFDKLELLRNCVRLIRRLGVKAEQVFSWSRITIGIEQAEDIKRVVKAKYDDDAWPKVAKPLSDQLRESQKHALVAYLLPRLGIQNSDKLYENLLIDVEMSPCMMTSRIKQAISSVQMFVQRCLINFEPEVSPFAIDTVQWEWMKRYRIWEANRKVFLYPENWIEPELRDDKTPFFKELESDMLQMDVTDESVEKALFNYLEKLDSIAKLQICGIFVQNDFDAKEKKKEVVHLFGRTANQPQSYYYRRYVVTSNDVAFWTPWEKVPVDVRGDQIAPIVWNRRLYLFWPLVTSKTQTEEPPAGTSEPEKGEPYDELQIAWSEYRSGKWSPKYVTDPEQALRISVNNPRLTAYLENNALTVVYEDANSRAICYEPGINLNGNKPTSTLSVTEVAEKGDGKFVFDNCHGELKLLQKPWVKRHNWGYSVSHTSIQPLGDGCIESLPTLDNYYEGRRLIEQEIGHASHDYFVFEDNERAFLVRLDAEPNGAGLSDRLYEKDLNSPYINKNSAALATEFDTRVNLGQTYFETLAQTTAVSNGWVSANAKFASLSLLPQMQNSSETSTESSTTALKLNKSVLSLDSDRHIYAIEPSAKLTYETFYHPFACEFIEKLERGGIPKVLNLDSQKLVSNPVFELRYKPHALHVSRPYPIERVDFGQTNNPAVYRSTAYSTYNWELFFHVPMLVAARLTNNQRFEEAIRWLQYVFNPTDGDGKYWKVLPFTTTPQENIEKLLEAITAKDPEMLKQLAEWRDHPFQPHMIARMRLGAYQKYVVMKSIETALACGDYYFRQDTIESINIALQYYVWCGNMLGEYPQKIRTNGKSRPQTFAELRKNLDAFSNAMKDFENKFPSYSGTSLVSSEAAVGLLGMRRSFYFCIPQNDKLLGYWDLVRDRMFKIRHCMNIEGVVRELALFEPPIDPALLVQAAAQGISLSSVMNDLNSPLPQHRFTYLMQKSLELCNDLRSLSSTLLSAIEKRDAEKLALLRQQHEKIILDLVKNVREKQIDEAFAAIEVLNETRERAVERYLYFLKNLGVEDLTKPAPGAQIPMKPLPNKINSEGGAHLIEEEKKALSESHSARDWQIRAGSTEMLTNILYYIPTLAITTKIPPINELTIEFGGKQIAPALAAIAQFQKNKSAEDAYNAGHADKMATHVRRAMGDVLQANDAACEIMQIDKQVLAARIRVEITKQELKNHEKQIQNAEVIEEFLTSKYTKEDLYSWIEGKANELYFQYFQLASDWAKKTERAFRFNFGLTTSNFIKPGAWDSLHKGLMAGEALALQLRQMDSAYHEQNKREYEITKHVSLLQINPLALIELRETGVCEFELPELLFDLDFPGHYFRRIKSASVSVPCVLGPFTSVCGTLTLLNNRIRFENVSGDYLEKFDEDDNRFIRDYVPLQSVATSGGQNDSGLFELNFRDERYLPFEGGGAISRWRFELPREFRQFDYKTISDLVLHLKYTAREGGEQLKASANKAIKSIIKIEEQKSLSRMFSLRHEFPTEWHKFLNRAESNGDHKQSFVLAKERFPFLFQEKKIKLYKVDLLVLPKSEDLDLTKLKLAKLKPNSDEINLNTDEIELKDAEKIGELVHRMGSLDNIEVSSDLKKSKWGLLIKKDDVENMLDQIEDILFVFQYIVS